KDYCVQDVVTLRDVYYKLPALVPEEKTLFYVDQQINDYGLLADVETAEYAVAADEENRRVASEETQKLLGSENPSSIPQMLEGLEDVGVSMPDLRAATVKEKLEEDLPEVGRKALENRQTLALSAAKKYQAILHTAGTDNRVRGAFMYHGAHTGRWCLTGDHEVLTNRGWVRLDEWEGGSIAVWSENQDISFQKAKSLKFNYDGEVYEYKNKRIKQVSTPEHVMPVQRKNGKVEPTKVSDIAGVRKRIFTRGVRLVSAAPVDNELRVLVMTQADGHYDEAGALRYKFTKSRKVERCRTILRRTNVPYVEHTASDGSTTISVPKRSQPLWLAMFKDKKWGTWLWDRNPAVFFDELVHWDAYQAGPNSVQYVTVDKNNADMIQAFAHLSGIPCRVTVKERDNPNWSTAYYLSLWLNPPETYELREVPEVKWHSGKVYCAETTTGYFLVRRNGSVWVTGNSGRGVQLQNLPRAQVRHPDAAILDLNMGFGASPQTLKSLVRAMFVGPFVVADFSAIEARVLAWIAGEDWVLEAFNDGRDIYVETAKKMSTGAK